MRTAADIASAPVLRNWTLSAHGITPQSRSAISTSRTLDNPETFPRAIASTTARVTFVSAYPRATVPSAMVQSRYSPPSASVTRQPTAWAKCVGPTASALPYNASTRLLPVDAPVGNTPSARVRKSASSCSAATSGSPSGSSDNSESVSGSGGAGAGACFAPRSKNLRKGIWRKRPRRWLASTPSARALDVIQDFDRHRAHQRELARVGRRAKGERPERSHDVLGKARLEEFDARERS